VPDSKKKLDKVAIGNYLVFTLRGCCRREGKKKEKRNEIPGG